MTDLINFEQIIKNSLISESHSDLHVSLYGQPLYKCEKVNYNNVLNLPVETLYKVFVTIPNGLQIIVSLYKLEDGNYSIGINKLLIPIDNKDVEFRRVMK